MYSTSTSTTSSIHLLFTPLYSCDSYSSVYNSDSLLEMKYQAINDTIVIFMRCNIYLMTDDMISIVNIDTFVKDLSTSLAAAFHTSNFNELFWKVDAENNPLLQS